MDPGVLRTDTGTGLGVGLLQLKPHCEYCPARHPIRRMTMEKCHSDDNMNQFAGREIETVLTGSFFALQYSS